MEVQRNTDGDTPSEDWAVITREGPKCPKNWDRNDYKNWAEMTWVEMTRVRNGLSLFRLIVIPIELGIVKQARLRKQGGNRHSICLQFRSFVGQT